MCCDRLQVNKLMSCGFAIPDAMLIRTWCKLKTHPDREGHAAVMNDVQCRDVLVLLSQNEEECVKELCELRYVVPPANVHHLFGIEFKFTFSGQSLGRIYPHSQATSAIVHGLAL